MTYPSPHEEKQIKAVDKAIKGIFYTMLPLVILLLIVFVASRSDAAIVKVKSNVDTLPYYLSADDVLRFEFVSDSATTATPVLCIKPIMGACSNSVNAISILGSNFASDTDEFTGSTTPYYSYLINVPLGEFFDSQATNSVDINYIYLIWGGSNVWQYRSFSGLSSNPAHSAVFHYDKYGHIPIATNSYQIMDIPILNFAMLFVIFILSFTFFISQLRKTKKSTL